MTDKSKKFCSKSSAKACVSVFLLAALNFLLGCQGISAGGTGIQNSLGILGSSLASIGFGNVTVGKTQTINGTITNTGGSTVSVSKVAITGVGFTLGGLSGGASLAAGQSANFSIQFAPIVSGTSNGNLTVTSDASNTTLTVPVSGVGTSAVGTLSSNPTSLSFSSTNVGQSQSLLETITNSGSASVNISQIAISGTGFSLVGSTSPTTLNAGESTSFNVKFAPSAAGNASGTVTVTSDASNPNLTVALSGSGTATPGQLSSSPTSLSFGSVTVGTNQSLSATVTNAGGTSVSVSSATISGTGYTLSGITTPLTLNAGQSTTFTVKFAPTTSGTASGTVTILSNASNPTLTVALSGSGSTTPGTLSSNPTTLSFGNVTDGSNQSLSATVTNTGGSNVTISTATISGIGFTLSGISTPLTVNAGQSTTFTVKFAPTTAGAASGTVTISSNASNPTLTVSLSGTGTSAVGTLSISPSTLNLGSVTVGNSGSATGQLTASGASVTVTAATTNNSVFSIGGLSLPVTIAAGKSVSFTITFSPTTSGTANGTLTVTSNASPTTSTESLTGTGAAASTHSVNLSWNASTSSNISGYNIYRALYTTSCGSYSKINTLLNTTTLYTDSTVANGSSYCYYATAVNTSSQESGASNIATNVQIP